MYTKKLYIIPPSRGKTHFIVPEIIKKESLSHKTIFWFCDKDNVEYCGLENSNVVSLDVKEWAETPFNQGNIYQIICKQGTAAINIHEIFFNIADDTNSVVIIDPAAHILGTEINPLLLDKFPADIHFLYDSMEQMYNCISENTPEKPEYKEKKYLDSCRREYHTYEKNRIFWLENRGVTKVKRKPGDPSNISLTQPLPTYQPYNIFGCTLYHYKIGSLPGMTIEEIIEEIKK